MAVEGVGESNKSPAIKTKSISSYCLAVANWLKQNNVHPGDRVAIAMRNFPEWLLCYWACVATGITVVGMNAWWVEDEMEYGLNDANPKVIFTDSERLERFLHIRDRFPDLITVGVRLPEEVDNVIQLLGL